MSRREQTRKWLNVMVGATGFEPATSCSQSRRATELRYAPTEALQPLAPSPSKGSSTAFRYTGTRVECLGVAPSVPPHKRQLADGATNDKDVRRTAAVRHPSILPSGAAPPSDGRRLSHNVFSQARILAISCSLNVCSQAGIRPRPWRTVCQNRSELRMGFPASLGPRTLGPRTLGPCNPLAPNP